MMNSLSYENNRHSLLKIIPGSIETSLKILEEDVSMIL
jgi:hypothetical protein